MPGKYHSHIEGLLNIDKPINLTSHDVVDRIRRQTRVPRVGHAGTLDPQASGVLLIGLGRGTKLVPFLHECHKIYRATLRLGVRTDSHDAAGKVIETRAVGEIQPEQVEAVFENFRGTIEQIPPMFSALKRQGQRLYTLARQGIEVERQPRHVQILRLTLLDLNAERLSLEVECSSGTYIRVLADDIGVRLGCGAHLAALVRTAIGPYTLAQALTLTDLEDVVRRGDWQRQVISLSQAGATFPSLVVTPAAAHSIGHGMTPTRQGIVRLRGTFEAEETVAILSPDGVLLAMASATLGSAEFDRLAPNAPSVQLRRVFHDSGSLA